MARIFEIRKGVFRRDVFIFGHRVLSFMRKGVVVDSILHHLEWQADYRTLHQHGIELPGESAYYWTAPESKVKVVIIPTDEELMIARDTLALIS